MTIATNLLSRLAEVGAKIEASGGRLVVRAGSKPVPGELVRRLRLAKTEVLAALAPKWWRDRYAARVVHWLLHGQRPWQHAECLAFAELILTWHLQHGTPPDPRCCAGCGDDLPDHSGLVIDREGSRVHLDGVRGSNCIIAYGARWRGAAVAGLHELGIEPPDGFELL